MILRAGFLIVAVVSAVKVCQITNKRSRKPSTSGEHGKVSFDEEQAEENGKSEESHVDPREKKEEQEETCKSKSVNRLNAKSLEFSVQENGRVNVSEIDILKNVVKEKEKMRESLEMRLLELYCLKEQQSRIALLQKQLNDRTSEINMLRETINKLQDEKKKLYEEVKLNQLAAEQLESAELIMLELQGQLELDSGQMKEQLLMLKEQVSGFHAKEESKENLKAIKVVELKALEVKRMNIQLQLEKRELVVKLSAANSKFAELSTMTEHKLAAKYKEEISRLKNVNKNLTEQVDKLHNDRLSILEELVYQRWLSTCLRFELGDHCSPSPKKIKPNVCRRSDLRSDSLSSGISSAESDEISNSTTTSSSSSENTKNKKKGFLQNIKRWGRRRDGSTDNASESWSFPSKAGKIRRFSTSSIPSSILGLRNRGERGLLIPLQKKGVDSNSPETPAVRRVRRVSFNDAITSVRYIYDDSPESDQGISDNGQKNADNFNDYCSDMKTSSGRDEILEGNNSEIPSSNVNSESHEASTVLGNQDTIETEVVRKEAVRAECLSQAMPCAASAASKFSVVVNLIAAIIIVLSLILFHFRPLFA
ncbi:protein CHUP1, chloroplastic-like [Coffea eugenioides]|uniref:protein CHUP1, chloroplastic-like n=1 Tax=Coffea eugenioides TaxID=49369 RepID=UPI000F60A060|nr:protein CHUP1, chloroplastic-like [Coffea eugenioides]